MTFSMGFLPLIDPPLIIPERDLVACVAVRESVFTDRLARVRGWREAGGGGGGVGGAVGRDQDVRDQDVGSEEGEEGEEGEEEEEGEEGEEGESEDDDMELELEMSDDSSGMVEASD